MKYRPFGKTGFETSEIGFGAWALGGEWGKQSEEDSLEALETAVAEGVNFIDTAAGYGNGKSEKIIGEFLRKTDKKIFVATKTPPLGSPWPPSPYCIAEERYPEQYLRENIDQRRKFLGVDTIDLLQLHTWTRAWNQNPRPLEILQQLKKEGIIRAIGISTPEQDQNAVIDLIRKGWVDSVQVIFNIFEQEPAAELLPAAKEHGVAVIARVPFDEGALTGKFNSETRFAEDDFRSLYFASDRLPRAVERAKKIEAMLAEEMPLSPVPLYLAALLFVLAREEVSVVIPGMRNAIQAKSNTAISDQAPLTPTVLKRLQQHAWLKGVWYDGK